MSSKTRDNPKRNLMIGLLAGSMILTGIVLFLVFSAILNTNTVNTGAAIVDAENAFDGSRTIDPPRELQDFTLMAHTGEPISLSDLGGQPTLLYFGYTNCPDVCPITLGDYKRVKQALDDQGNQVNYVMISVDGKRDTPERLNSYLSAYDDSFIGMSGDAQTLDRIGVDYGLFYELHDDGSRSNYLVDHTASIFLVNSEGLLTTIYSFGTEPEIIIEDLQTLLG